MNQPKNFIAWHELDVNELSFQFGQERNGKPTIYVCNYGANAGAGMKLITPPAVTLWPKVTGDGNFGTHFGPKEESQIQSAKYQLDLTDTALPGMDSNPDFEAFRKKMDELDAKLLDFVYANQLKVLGRKNLKKEELAIMQFKTVKPKIDKNTGNVQYHCFNLSTGTYQLKQGQRVKRTIDIVDKDNRVLAGGQVNPGDIVAAKIYLNQIYTQVSGDKFGIHFAPDSVQVLMQAHRAPPPTVNDFTALGPLPDWAMPYHDEQFEHETTHMDLSTQFPDPVGVQ